MPLTFDILSDIQAFIIPTCDDDTVRCAAITAGHFLMLRAGEFTVLSRDLFDPFIHLTCSYARLHSFLLARVSLPPTYKIKRISNDRVWPFILLIRDAPSVLVALWKRTSLFTIAVVSSTRLLHSCFTFPTDAPSAKYPSSLSSLTD